MPATQFDRDLMARWYAKQHLETDSGIRSIWYLPTNAPDREIRFVEINALIADRTDDALEPVDFGVDIGTESEHQLLVLDVTPSQWERISDKSLALPSEWSLDNAEPFPEAE
ncbi:MAG: hypothetical protein N2C14_30805 [Planctomycetales bacterium]